MTLFDGAALKLSMAGEEGGTTFLPLGGLVSKVISFNGTSVISNKVQQHPWRKSIDGAGEINLRISGSGVFEGGNVSKKLIELMMLKRSRQWRVEIAGLGLFEGDFTINRFEITGPYAEVEQFSIALQSSGEIKFTGEGA